MRKFTKTSNLHMFFMLYFCVSACGGGMQQTQNTQSDDVVQEDASKESGTFTIEGSRGSLGWDEVKPVFEENMDSLFRCYEDVLDDLGEFLSGSVEFDFIVKLDGSVRNAFISTSNLGSQRVHKCLIRKLKKLQFPEPHGGEAEVTYSMDMLLDMAGAEPKEWTMNDIAEYIGRVHGDIDGCMNSGRGVNLTIYVDMGGRVIETGAASTTHEMQEAADCLSEAAMMWTFPDPGQNMAKISLEF